VPIIVATQVKRWIAKAIGHGGERQRAARKAEAILGALNIGRDPREVGRMTSHGESRIRCSKYDLGNGFRLVTLRRGDALILLYMGSHEAVDHRLDQLRGTSFEVEGVVGPIQLPEPEAIAIEKTSKDPPQTQRLIAPLSDVDLDELSLRASDVRALTRLTPDSSDEELAAAVSELGQIRRPMLQILQFLRNGDNARARQTLHALQPQVALTVGLDEEPPEEAPSSLSKKKRRAARRAARAGRAEADESSFNRMDQEYLHLLRQRAERAAQAARVEEEQARRAQAQKEEEGLSFAELLERFEGSGDGQE
jgi:hypothetical protein